MFKTISLFYVENESMAFLVKAIVSPGHFRNVPPVTRAESIYEMDTGTIQQQLCINFYIIIIIRERHSIML